LQAAEEVDVVEESQEAEGEIVRGRPERSRLQRRRLGRKMRWRRGGLLKRRLRSLRGRGLLGVLLRK
jgi:hypothetical protein